MGNARRGKNERVMPRHLKAFGGNSRKPILGIKREQTGGMDQRSTPISMINLGTLKRWAKVMLLACGRETVVAFEFSRGMEETGNEPN